MINCVCRHAFAITEPSQKESRAPNASDRPLARELAAQNQKKLAYSCSPAEKSK